MTIVKYLNPRNDVAFKKIFGTEKNKDILIHFLNDIIVTGENKPIKKVTLLNPVQYPDIATSKQSVVDVLCEDEDGIIYIVEMQVAKVAGFEKRAQYYAAKAYASQPEKGDKTYEHLKAVIFLAITEYEMFPKKKHYKSDHVILDKESYDRDLKDFSFTFIELPKFTKKKISELKNYEEKWCYFFRYAHDADNIEELLANSDEVIRKAYHQLETHNWTKEELRAYEASEKSARDARAREEYVRGEARAEALMEGRAEGKAQGIAEGKAQGIAEGKAQGIAEGKAQGIAEGKAQGIAEGKAQGIAEGKAQGIAEGKAQGIAEGKAQALVEGKAEVMMIVAKNMLLNNEPLEKIQKFTGLPMQEIMALLEIS